MSVVVPQPVSPSLLSSQEILQDVFGYQDFRQGQQAVIEAITAGNDCLVIMPTGGGKSLCYQIPALMLSGLTLVISPLISLMKDQVDQLNANGVSAGCIHSAMSREEIQATFDAMQTGKLQLVYASPERVLMRDFIERLQQIDLSMVAVDEAHCVSQIGRASCRERVCLYV